MQKSAQWAAGMPAVAMHERREHQVHLGKGQRASGRGTLPCWGPFGHSFLLGQGSFTSGPHAAVGAFALLSCSSSSIKMHKRRARPMGSLLEDPHVLSGHLMHTWPAESPCRECLVLEAGCIACRHQYVNQFPYEGCMIAKDLLPQTLRRLHSHQQAAQGHAEASNGTSCQHWHPAWFPATYDLATEVQYFIRDYAEVRTEYPGTSWTDARESLTLSFALPWMRTKAQHRARNRGEQHVVSQDITGDSSARSEPAVPGG